MKKKNRIQCSCWGCQKGSAKRRIIKERQANKDFREEMKEIHADLCSYCKVGKLALISWSEEYHEDWYQCISCGSTFCL